MAETTLSDFESTPAQTPTVTFSDPIELGATPSSPSSFSPVDDNSYVEEKEPQAEPPEKSQIEVEPEDADWNVPPSKLPERDSQPERDFRPDPIIMDIPSKATSSFNLETILIMLMSIIIVTILVILFIHFVTPYSILGNRRRSTQI